MSRILFIIAGLLVFTNSFGQKLDTLKVIVLSPYKIEVADNYLAEYNNIKKEVADSRTAAREQKLKEKQENIDDFNQQPDYVKMMFDNELGFYDSLTINNYISMIVREYIAYRLYRPYKIKPRLILLSTTTSPSDKKKYAAIAKGKQNFFIVNFTQVRFYKDAGENKIETNIELYSGATNEILYSKSHTGLPKGGMTDYPMCSGNNWDCALVNSVYPALYDILKLISENYRK